MHPDQTLDERAAGMPRVPEPVPGLLVVFSAGKPLHLTVPLAEGPRMLGRGVRLGQHVFDDAWMSRAHVEVAHQGGAFAITDQGSRNGSSLDGKPFTGSQ